MEKRFKIGKLKIKPKIIVITGAESTGKTTLTEQLAAYFGVPFLPEIAREYVENLNGKYTFSDVEKIAKMQIEQFTKISKSNAPFIFIDTWLIVTKIWFEFVYKKVPNWLTLKLKEQGLTFFWFAISIYPGCLTRLGKMEEKTEKYFIINTLRK